MNKHISWNELDKSLINDKNERLVDVIASEMPEIFAWFGIDTTNQTEMQTWELHKDVLVQKLRGKFQVAILRTSNYTHEIIITSDEILGPTLLDYGSLETHKKVGYGDFRTAKQMHSFLSPRIVLASKSPQRFDLLGQIVAPSKIEVVVSNSSEEKVAYETPHDRVKRLALKKADAVFKAGNYHNDIELIIGADTEIIRKREDGEWDMIGHPQTVEHAIQDLTSLNGKSHYAVTGIAIIGRDPETNKVKRFTDYVETKITFGNLSPEQIRSYAETGEPIARAGAYAIQGLGTMLIKDLDGSYSNVVGLPLERLSEILAQEFNKPIWLFDKVSNWTFPAHLKDLPLS
jgi:septum formation protein